MSPAALCGGLLTVLALLVTSACSAGDGPAVIEEARPPISTSTTMAVSTTSAAPSDALVQFPSSIDDPAFCDAFMQWSELPVEQRDVQLAEVLALIGQDSETPETMSEADLAPLSSMAQFQLIDISVSTGCDRPDVPSEWAAFCGAMRRMGSARGMDLHEFTDFVISRLSGAVAAELAPSLMAVADAGALIGSGGDRTVVFPDGYSDETRRAWDHVSSRFTQYCVVPYVVPPNEVRLGADANLPPPSVDDPTG